MALINSFYFQYSDISSIHPNILNDVCANIIVATIDQDASAVIGKSVAECATYGLTQLYFTYTDASFMILTTDSTSSANQPRLQYCQKWASPPVLGNYFYPNYLPNSTSQNNKQLFCDPSSVITLSQQDTIDSITSGPVMYYNFPYDASYSVSDASFVGNGQWFGNFASSSPGFGYSISYEANVGVEIPNKRFAVGCFDSRRSDSSGVVIIYKYNESSSFTQEEVIYPNTDSTGAVLSNSVGASPVYSVSLFQNETARALAIGQPFDVSNGLTVGSVSIYYHDSTNIWEKKQVLYGDILTDGSNALFGWSVYLAGTGFLAIGSPGANNNYGKVYVRRTNDAWDTLNLPDATDDPSLNVYDISGTENGEFGRALYLSPKSTSNTKLLAVGAPSCGPVTSGFQSSRTGQVFIFISTGSGRDWSLSDTFTGTSDLNSSFGWCLSGSSTNDNNWSGKTALCVGQPGSNQTLDGSYYSDTDSRSKFFIYDLSTPGGPYSLIDSVTFWDGFSGSTGPKGTGGSISFRYPYILIGNCSEIDFIGAGGYASQVYKYFIDSNFTTISKISQLIPEDLSYSSVSSSYNSNSNFMGYAVVTDVSFDILTSLIVDLNNSTPTFSSNGIVTVLDPSGLHWDYSMNSVYDISFANEIKFFENQWADNGESDVSSSYFQWSDISDNKVDSIVYNSPQFVDISKNYAKCAAWATQFLGTIGFDPNNEEKERKYFVLYTNETDPSNLRIQFYYDTAGAYFDPSNTGPNYNQQVFTSLPDTSFVSLANTYDFSMSYATPLYFTESTWLANGGLTDSSSSYFMWSDISGYTIDDIPLGGAFDGSSVQQMASYGTSFLGQTLVDMEGVPRECKYFVLYTNDLSENRIEFKYDISGVNAGGYFNNNSTGPNYNQQIFTALQDTSAVSNSPANIDFSMSYATPFYFTESTWLNNGPLTDSSSSYFMWSDISGYTIDDIPLGGAFDGSSVQQMASYGTSFLGQTLVDMEGVPRECKYFVLYTNDLSENRIEFKYDISGVNAGGYFNNNSTGPNYNQQIFTALQDTSAVSNSAANIDFSMSYATPFYFTESTWLNNGSLVGPDSNFYFQWSDISGYTIDDIPIGGAFDGSSVAQMASYGTSFLGQTLVDIEGIPRICKYFILYTNNLSENRIEFKYDASGNNAGAYYSPYGLNTNKQLFCSSANAIEIIEGSNNVTGGFDCSFANEIKFFEDKWADNNQLVAPSTTFFRTTNIVAQYDGSANPQVDIISYNAPQLTGIASNYGECAGYAFKFLGTIGLTDPSGTGNWEEEERKYFVLIMDDTDPSSARIKFMYDGSGAYYDPNCQVGGLALNTQIFCPTTDVVQLQAAPGPNYEPYLTTIGTNTMSSANPRYFSG